MTVANVEILTTPIEPRAASNRNGADAQDSLSARFESIGPRVGSEWLGETQGSTLEPKHPKPTQPEDGQAGNFDPRADQRSQRYCGPTDVSEED
jgi:hypothetical protein